jgi:hypothetical protein
MAQEGYDGIMALTTLRAKLDADSSMEVIHENGCLWRPTFRFHPSATDEEIDALKMRLAFPLPQAYEHFLRYSNGAVLYYGTYGQWGFQLYGTHELVEKNEARKHIYKEDWPATYLVFAESFGDSDVLLFNGTQKADGQWEYWVLDGDSGYPPGQYRMLTKHFGNWLDRLVVAQGAKYWRWR